MRFYWCYLSLNEPSDAHRLAGSLFVSCGLRLLVNSASNLGLQSRRDLFSSASAYFSKPSLASISVSPFGRGGLRLLEA